MFAKVRQKPKTLQTQQKEITASPWKILTIDFFFYHSILHVLLMFFFYHSVAPVEMGPRGNSGDDAPNRECYVRKELPANELPADALKQTSVPRSGPRWALNGPMKYN